MQAYIIRRLLLVIPTLILITIIVFSLIRVIPGDLIELMMDEQSEYTPTPMDREEFMKGLGLETLIYVLYVRWVGSLLQVDLGKSLWSERRVIDEMKRRLPVSIELGLLAIIISQLVAIPVGVFSAIRQDTPSDYVGRTLAISFLCIPNFWLGLLVMLYPAKWWGWVPPVQYVPLLDDPIGNFGQFLIPAVILGLSSSGTTMRIMRTMTLEVLRQDYIRTAWAKGLKERVVITRHALKNALIPVVTIIGLQIPLLIGGTVILEDIFNLPGMGRLILYSLNQRDFTMLSGVNLFIAVFVLFNNLIIDISYSYLDPRIRYK